MVFPVDSAGDVTKSEGNENTPVWTACKSRNRSDNYVMTSFVLGFFTLTNHIMPSEGSMIWFVLTLKPYLFCLVPSNIAMP